MDPEIFYKDNLIENKHLKLTRSKRRGPQDRELKPNPVARDQLSVITKKSPADPILAHEKDLVGTGLSGPCGGAWACRTTQSTHMWVPPTNCFDPLALAIPFLSDAREEGTDQISPLRQFYGSR